MRGPPASLRRVLVLGGPTAIGKTSMSVMVSRLLGGSEIVSADSVQLYRGMVIGSGSFRPGHEPGGVPHHLVGTFDPTTLPRCPGRPEIGCAESIRGPARPSDSSDGSACSVGPVATRAAVGSPATAGMFRDAALAALRRCGSRGRDLLESRGGGESCAGIVELEAGEMRGAGEGRIDTRGGGGGGEKERIAAPPPILVGGSPFYLAPVLKPSLLVPRGPGVGAPEAPAVAHIDGWPRDTPLPPFDPHDRIPEEVRVFAREVSLSRGRDWESKLAVLRDLDPEYAARVGPNDTVRLERAIALAVWSRGRALAGSGVQAQDVPVDGLGEWDWRVASLVPHGRAARAALAAAIDTREEGMFLDGLLVETATLLRDGLDPRAAHAQAVGYRQALAFLSAAAIPALLAGSSCPSKPAGISPVPSALVPSLRDCVLAAQGATRRLARSQRRAFAAAPYHPIPVPLACLAVASSSSVSASASASDQGAGANDTIEEIARELAAFAAEEDRDRAVQALDAFTARLRAEAEDQDSLWAERLAAEREEKHRRLGLAAAATRRRRRISPTPGPQLDALADDRRASDLIDATLCALAEAYTHEELAEMQRRLHIAGFA